MPQTLGYKEFQLERATLPEDGELRVVRGKTCAFDVGTQAFYDEDDVPHAIVTPAVAADSKFPLRLVEFGDVLPHGVFMDLSGKIATDHYFGNLRMDRHGMADFGGYCVDHGRMNWRDLRAQGIVPVPLSSEENMRECWFGTEMDALLRSAREGEAREGAVTL
jgi:hypothetical protein